MLGSTHGSGSAFVSEPNPLAEISSNDYADKSLLEDPMVKALKGPYEGFVTAVQESMGKTLGGLVLRHM